MSYLKKLLVEKNWHRVFELGIFLKGLNGVFELISGTFILFVSKNTFTNIFIRFSRTELLEDPHDRLINFLTSWIQHLSINTKTFAAIYILIHGILNIFLSIQLYREKLWAYLVTIGALILFISYQLFRISHNHSLILTLITVWDIFFIVVTWHEYKYKKSLIKVN